MTNDDPQPLLILDVDETLIYGSERELECPADLRVGPFHIYRRPHLDSFLASVAEWYTLAIWSSATIDYVSGIAAAIRPQNVEFEFVWGVNAVFNAWTMSVSRPYSSKTSAK